jgi:hypothetical protein
MLAAGAVLILAACGGDSDAAPAAGTAAAAGTEPTETLIRVPADGGSPTLHRAADLAAIPWTDAPSLPAVAEVIGAVGDDRIVYLLNRKQELLGLDVESGRLREIAGGIAMAAAAPDGGVVAVDTAGGALRIRRRTPQPLRGTLEGTARVLYPTQRGGLLAPLGGGRGGIVALGPDHPPARTPLADGPTAATTWGELVAVGTDSGLVFYDPRAEDSVTFVATKRPVHAVAFSPSGHRIYAATPDAELLVLDRFGEEVLERVTLPGPAGALRVDRYGRWLVARPIVGDSLWAVDLVADRLAGSARAIWRDDLPAIAGDRLVVRQGKDVVLLDLRATGLPRRGIIEGGGADRWALVQWTPPAAAGAPARNNDTSGGESAGPPADGAVDAGDEPAGAAGDSPVYLQVSSSRNPDWANDLVRQMKSAGLPASLLDPTGDGEPYRVVLGPYPSREAADEAGRRLGRAYFIIGGRDSTASVMDEP